MPLPDNDKICGPSSIMHNPGLYRGAETNVFLTVNFRSMVTPGPV